MDKHIELLTELLAWYWNRSNALSNHWEHLSLDTRQDYIRFYINQHLNELWENI